MSDAVAGPSAPGRAAVALVVSGPAPPAWEHRVLALLAAEPGLEVFAVPGRPAPPAPLRSLTRAIERRLFGGSEDALATTALALPPGIPAPTGSLRVHLDGPPPDGSAPALWLAHGDGGVATHALEVACERAVATRGHGVRSEVRLRRADGGEQLLAATVSGVRAASATLSPNEIRWKLAGLVARAVARAAAHPLEPGAAAVPPLALPEPDSAAASTRRRRARAVPPPLRWLRALAVRGRYRRPWRVCLREGDGAFAPLPDRIQPPQDTAADPFLLERDGRLHLFAEHVPHGERNGLISHADLSDPEGRLRPVLRAPHHLSYPFVFTHGDDVLMIPETASARRVELWRAARFPDEWVLDRVLFEDTRLADATVFEHAGRWWLLGTVGGPAASLGDELHVFSAPDPRGPWAPHPANPVVSDARCARPAGPVRHVDGRLIRPGQDGSRRYGGAVSLREITTLTPTAYAERPIGRIEPSQVAGARALHHVCQVGTSAVCDIRVRLPRNR